MIDSREVEKAIFNRLKGLASTLKQYGIPLAFLPKEAANYREDRMGAIRIIVPEMNSQSVTTINIPVQNPDDYDETYTVPITQDIDVDLLIRLSLPKRYEDSDTEQDVLSFLAKKIVLTLMGYAPLSVATIRKPLYFRNYKLLQPEGDRWIANILMGFTAQITVRPEEAETYVLGVQLFATDDIEFLQNNTLLSTIGSVDDSSLQ